MPFKVEFRDGAVDGWHTTADGGARRERVTDYRPSIYASPPRGSLDALGDRLASNPKVAGVGVEEWYLRLDADERSPVLRIDVERLQDVDPLARELKHDHERDLAAPGGIRLYNVDLSPEFRYALETGTDPTLDREPTMLSLSISEKALADRDLTRLECAGEPLGSDPADVLATLDGRLRRVDPDVLVCSSADLVPLAFEAAERLGMDEFRLGREAGYDRLAGANTYGSYGRVGHSPARYDVPGRAILDRSNSFLWQRSNLSGLLYLIERSWKPVQELGWASIGTVLTAIQIREAFRERDVLIPWNKYRPEEFKDVHTLHAADRGGFTFQPDVGLHEDVSEVDFASLYPRIICEENISPDTVLCDCHPDNTPIQDLPYNVCTEDGFLGDVLRPLLDDRAAIKDRLSSLEGNNPGGDGSHVGNNIGEEDVGDRSDVPPLDLHADVALDPTSPDDLAAVSSAVKWILVSCFGYQGYRNSKFGRIECHEAINAVARDVLLTAKEHAERRGWRVVHGIVDSLWLSPVEADATPLSAVTDAVSAEIGIALDRETRYDWVAFVSKRESSTGALTRYYGKLADEAAYKVRGIEARQRSTPTFVESVQRDLLEVVDERRDPGAVCDRLRAAIARLHARQVEPADLVIRTRVSKALEDYRQETRTVAALERSRSHGLDREPGQDVRYVVVDDAADGRQRVRLAFEDVPDYDADFYTTQLVRACESVVSPLGWDRTDVRRYLAGEVNYELGAFS